MKDVFLRDVLPEDLPIFFGHQQDPVAIEMVAFTFRDPQNWQLFEDHWRIILANPKNILKTILYQGQVSGNVVSFVMDEKREVGYWLGQEFWGKGIATASIKQFLQLIEERPLYAHVAQDNLASLKVLKNCGFGILGQQKTFSSYRNVEISETVLSFV